MGQEIAEDLAYFACRSGDSRTVEAFAANDSLLTKQLREKNIAVCNQLPQLSQVPLNQRVICLQGDDYGKNFSGDRRSFNTVITRLSAGKKGFFTMIEGAKVDKGGHANDLYTVVDEYLSFDRWWGKLSNMPIKTEKH